VKERRLAQRYGLKLAVDFRRVPGHKENEVLGGETANISTGGMYFTTVAQSLALDEVLDFTLTFPGLVHGADVCVIGRARVVRVVEASGSKSKSVGVAMVTEEYHILGARTSA
jgi:hypothetical protein